MCDTLSHLSYANCDPFPFDSLFGRLVATSQYTKEHVWKKYKAESEAGYTFGI